MIPFYICPTLLLLLQMKLFFTFYGLYILVEEEGCHQPSSQEHRRDPQNTIKMNQKLLRK
jgi:hypothetical protein